MAALAGMSVAKLEIMEKAFKNLADVAKNSASLNDMFQSMKEGSLVLAPYHTFLRLLKAETTRKSAETASLLFDKLSSPATQLAIDALAGSFTSLTDEAALSLVAINNLVSAVVELGNKSDGTRTKLRNTTNELINNLAEFIRILGRLSSATSKWNVVGREFQQYFEDATAGIGRRTQSEHGR